MPKVAKQTLRTATPSAAGRRPAQKRSLARVNALLDAADALLREREIGDVGLYDIARLADVPPTSVYHFFPTKEAALLGLAERYLEHMHQILQQPLDLTQVDHWIDLVTIRYYRVVNYFNENLPARKLFIGLAIGSDVKMLDFADMDNLVTWTYRSMNTIFDMPYVKDPTLKFSVLFGIYDGVWATSYAKRGYITPEYAREGLRAGIAYLSTFLPTTIALREPGAEPVPIPAAKAVTPQVRGLRPE